MVSSIERELKTLLSKAEYEKLYTYFNLQNQPKIIQSNYYYDTADEIFKQNNSALRLRVFDNGSSEWTIKERVSELESIELTQFNREKVIDVPQALNEDIIYSADIQEFIASRNIVWTDIKRTMSLITERYNIDVPYGLYALDYTQYPQAEDYELELESQDIKTELTNKLNKHQIEIVDQREQPDFIISIGGDGTFLSAFHHFEQYIEHSRFVGIHTGHLGFYTDWLSNEVDAVVDGLLNASDQSVSYPLLNVEIYLEDGRCKKMLTLNEFSIRSTMGTMVSS